LFFNERQKFTEFLNLRKLTTFILSTSRQKIIIVGYIVLRQTFAQEAGCGTFLMEGIEVILEAILSKGCTGFSF